MVKTQKEKNKKIFFSLQQKKFYILYLFLDSPHICIIIHSKEGKRTLFLKMFYITQLLNSQKMSKKSEQTCAKKQNPIINKQAGFRENVVWTRENSIKCFI